MKAVYIIIKNVFNGCDNFESIVSVKSSKENVERSIALFERLNKSENVSYHWVAYVIE